MFLFFLSGGVANSTKKDCLSSVTEAPVAGSWKNPRLTKSEDHWLWIETVKMQVNMFFISRFRELFFFQTRKQPFLLICEISRFWVVKLVIEKPNPTSNFLRQKHFERQLKHKPNYLSNYKLHFFFAHKRGKKAFCANSGCTELKDFWIKGQQALVWRKTT